MKKKNQQRRSSKIPLSIFPKLEAIGLTDACYYRLLDMITFNNSGEGCALSNAHFLRELGISESRLKRLLRTLEARGFIKREVIRAHNSVNTGRNIYPSDEVRTAWAEEQTGDGDFQ